MVVDPNLPFSFICPVTMPECHIARPDYSPELLTRMVSNCELNIYTWKFPRHQGYMAEWLRVWPLELELGLGFNVSNTANYLCDLWPLNLIVP